MTERIHISLTIFGDEQYSRRVNRIGERADHLRPVLEWARDQMIDMVEGQFDTEGARGGDPWKQLAFTTIKKRGSDHPILIDSGDLLDEMLTPDSYDIDDEGVTFHQGGVGDEYGHFHQTGTAKMDARPIFDMTPLDRSRITRGINRWIMEGVIR